MPPRSGGILKERAMFNKVQNYIKAHVDIETETPHILLGLSGGPDSVFLLYFLKKLRDKNLVKLSAAHLNHGWRKEADSEEEFCKNLCEKLGIKLYAQKAQNLDLKTKPNGFKPNGSKEELGRLLRRHFFEQIKKNNGIDYIALAHHQQDQQETFFIRLIRGCSLSGLTSIKPVQSNYIRPLLTTSKSEILKFLDENKICYVCDQSNQSQDFLRNRIRKHVLPALRAVDPRFDQKFESSLEALEQENILLQDITNQAYKSVFEQNSGLNPPVVGNKKKFMGLPSVLQKRIIIDWLCNENVQFRPSTGFLDEIIRFLASERGGTHNLHDGWHIKKKQDSFWILTD
jgi:tRNA(Ile)-lysidine synthase